MSSPVPSTKARRLAGFTLVELIVTIMIVAILAAVAVPSYMSSIRKSRRTEARQALLDLAGREERYLATNSSYSNTPADLGYSTFPATTTSGYYTIDVPSGNLSAPTTTTAAYFKATAAPVAGAGQDKDTQCASFTVDSTGVQHSTDSSGTDTTSICWK